MKKCKLKTIAAMLVLFFAGGNAVAENNFIQQAEEYKKALKAIPKEIKALKQIGQDFGTEAETIIEAVIDEALKYASEKVKQALNSNITDQDISIHLADTPITYLIKLEEKIKEVAKEKDNIPSSELAKRIAQVAQEVQSDYEQARKSWGSRSSAFKGTNGEDLFVKFVQEKVIAPATKAQKVFETERDIVNNIGLGRGRIQVSQIKKLADTVFGFMELEAGSSKAEISKEAHAAATLLALAEAQTAATLSALASASGMGVSPRVGVAPGGAGGAGYFGAISLGTLVAKNGVNIQNLRHNIYRLAGGVMQNAAQINKNTALLTEVVDDVKELDTRTTTVENEVKRLDGSLNNFAMQVGKNKKQIETGLAQQSALSGLFQPYDIGRVNVTAAIGGYNQRVALALGSSYRFDKKLATKVGLAFGGQGVSYHAGVNYQF